MNFGIYTLNDNENYGNRLQNYAVQYIFGQYGNVFNMNELFSDNKVRIKYALWKLTGGSIERIFRNKNYRIYRSIDFNRKLNYNKKSADYYIYGSDQIWNPFYAEKFFIDPVTPKEKNIAFCASIGMDNIPKEYENLFSEGLKKFTYVSVREKSAVDIVTKYRGYSPEILLDPTMYLTAKQWRSIERKPKVVIPEKYILVYFLGEYEKQKIYDFAAIKNIPIIDLSERECAGKFSPEEFLYLIDNAFYVITDSFHASVFSIIFRKRFSVSGRKDNDISMNSRIHTLLERFDMQEHFVKGDMLYCMDEIPDVTGVLEYERNRTDEFIRKATGINKKE